MTVVDADQSSLSRQLVRTVDATPSMRVDSQAPSLEAARGLVVRNRAYAVILIPADMERDVRRGESPRWLPTTTRSTRSPPVSSVATSGRRSARCRPASSFARGRRRENRRTWRWPTSSRSGWTTHTLFNPQLNYLYYLVAALLPTLLQIFVMVTGVHALGVELKEGTAGEWMAAAGGSAWRAVLGKLLPYVATSRPLGLFMLVVLFRFMGVPAARAACSSSSPRPSCSSRATWRWRCWWWRGRRTSGSAGSIAALYSAPAFAFVGITFP